MEPISFLLLPPPDPPCLVGGGASAWPLPGSSSSHPEAWAGGGSQRRVPGKAPLSGRPAHGQKAAAVGLNGASPPAADSSGLDHLPGKRKEEAGLTTGVVKKGKMAAAATQSSTHKNQQSFVCTCQPPSCPPRPCLANTARSGLGGGGGRGAGFLGKAGGMQTMQKGPVVNRGQPAGRLPQESTKCQDQPFCPPSPALLPQSPS